MMIKILLITGKVSDNEKNLLNCSIKAKYAEGDQEKTWSLSAKSPYS